MLVEDSYIYPFIKEYVDKMPIIKISKGTIFSNAEDIDKQIYYILSGTVKVECMSALGKKILIDLISENEFAGQISYMRKHNLYGYQIAIRDLELLCINQDILNVLMENSEFTTAFYFKTSNRVYQMYKRMLMNNLFSQSELVAYHILDKSHMGKFVYTSIYDMCENINISRRSLYNILNNLQEQYVIKKEQNGIFIIKDVKYLRETSYNVKMFLENKY